MNFLNPNDVVPEAITMVIRDLQDGGVSQFTIVETAPPRPAHALGADRPVQEGRQSRVVIMQPDYDKAEIMVAMEGAGCIFITPATGLNPYVFVTAGFQLTPAQILTKLFVGMANARASDVSERALLTHQDRS
jgi:hypothetical protein